MAKTHLLRPQPTWRVNPEGRPWCGAKKPEVLLDGADLIRLETNRWRPPDGVCSKCWPSAWRHSRMVRWPLLGMRWAADYSDASRDELEGEMVAMLAVVTNHWEEYVGIEQAPYDVIVSGWWQ